VPCRVGCECLLLFWGEGCGRCARRRRAGSVCGLFFLRMSERVLRGLGVWFCILAFGFDGGDAHDSRCTMIIDCLLRTCVPYIHACTSPCPRTNTHLPSTINDHKHTPLPAQPYRPVRTTASPSPPLHLTRPIPDLDPKVPRARQARRTTCAAPYRLRNRKASTIQALGSRCTADCMRSRALDGERPCVALRRL
jgi:hypothetical protein